MKQLVESGVYVNSVYQAGFTAIFYAAIEGRLEATQWLLACGADPSVQNQERRTPLHWAARGGHVEVLRALLKARAPVDVRDGTWRTPLDIAQQKKHHMVVEILRSYGAKQ